MLVTHKIMKDKLVKTIVEDLNPNDNGGESILLTTWLYDNGDEQDFIYANQQIELNSYCNSASMFMSGFLLNPDKLRELANKLEKQINKVNSR